MKKVTNNLIKRNLVDEVYSFIVENDLYGIINRNGDLQKKIYSDGADLDDLEFDPEYFIEQIVYFDIDKKNENVISLKNISFIIPYKFRKISNPYEKEGFQSLVLNRAYILESDAATISWEIEKETEEVKDLKVDIKLNLDYEVKDTPKQN